MDRRQAWIAASKLPDLPIERVGEIMRLIGSRMTKVQAMKRLGDPGERIL